LFSGEGSRPAGHVEVQRRFELGTQARPCADVAHGCIRSGGAGLVLGLLLCIKLGVVETALIGREHNVDGARLVAFPVCGISLPKDVLRGGSTRLIV